MTSPAPRLRERTPPEAPPAEPRRRPAEAAEPSTGRPSGEAPERRGGEAEAPPEIVRRRELVGDLLGRLCGGPAEADGAYRELLRIPAELIPEFLPHLERTEATSFYELRVTALHDKIARRSDEDGRIYYFVKGMGRFALDDIAAGPARESRPGRRAMRIVMRRYEQPFPLGVVLRTALLNRMKSQRYPSFDDKDDLPGWWRAYYELWAERR